MSNRLATEDSPYLQQHKNNPVDWFPWCDEAFAKAEAENKAIFISIGYSSCHWCHVMEEKVFENQECADILNAGFVCIKVDREERPDIDKHYQEVHQLLNRRAGGWPTSIFCTPQNKPFFAGTYIPPESTQGSVQGMGFKELTTLIAAKVAEGDPKLFQNANEVEGFLNKRSHPKEATVLKEDFTKNFMLQAKGNYETKHGGFSVAPKFPHSSTLNALLVVDRLYDDISAKSMYLHTLNSMTKGGMYDLVDGGFCRYSVDDMFLVPHFEKMLYDNALLCDTYTKAYLAYGDEAHLQIAKEVADFWHNFMSEDNLFYSASDADSEGEEGTYFVYDYEEVYTVLKENGYENAESMLDEMQVTQSGNFEGKNIIRFESGKRADYFEDVKLLLQDLRKKREYPFCDKKIQTSWSSMMINSLFTLGQIDHKYTNRAVKNLDALLKSMYIDGVLYHTTLIHKTPKVAAFLEDYAFLAQALISAFKQTQDEIYLIHAQRFANKALEEFYNKGDWSFSSGEFVTKAEIHDLTYTSSVAIIVDVLLSLGTLLEDEKYTHFAFKTMEYNSYELGRKPIYCGHMLIQALRYLKGDRIIKSNMQNLLSNTSKLATLSYPFVMYKHSADESFMICGDKSCFANTQDLDKINDLIHKSL
ncbi:MAG: thioredoxin domain-containing protein [Sulfurimonas sp.]|nr:thioredoxin domain-containing protein [Sulfurimonas sp.]MBU3939096.1 thioredoxin domain-containing protein [bacterium]MBU4024510.1 thioredoxin domain-containing protein [bacterium]MBU4058061.1 thioredoxin domain-containing protein [bacterium]MBU4111100.1 thioredoxin domain-containing protein [bacterium]